MIIFNLIVLSMLTLNKKPYNPNYGPSKTEDINWNKSDILSFLDNIHNVPLNDIAISGKGISFYQTATKAEIASELIGTINLTHYKLLSAVKDVINYNNFLINQTQKRNDSIDFCVKEIKKLATQTQRNNFLLLKFVHNNPDLLLAGSKTYSDEPIDPIIDEPTDQIIIASPEHTTTTQNQATEPRLDTNVDELTSAIINDSVFNPTTNDSDDSTTPRIDTIIAEPSHPTINGSPEQTIQLQTTQSNCGPTISSAIMRDQNILLNEPQLNHDTINITASPTTVTFDDAHTNTFDKTIQVKKTVKSPQFKSKIKKIKTKIKMKKKKKKIKNHNKRINKKKIKRQKQKKLNIIVKNNITNFDLEQIIRTYFTDDDYQEWMNIRLYDNDYTAIFHYEKTYGISAINKIKQAHANDHDQ